MSLNDQVIIRSEQRGLYIVYNKIGTVSFCCIYKKFLFTDNFGDFIL